MILAGEVQPGDTILMTLDKENQRVKATVVHPAPSLPEPPKAVEA